MEFRLSRAVVIEPLNELWITTPRSKRADATIVAIWILTQVRAGGGQKSWPTYHWHTCVGMLRPARALRIGVINH